MDLTKLLDDISDLNKPVANAHLAQLSGVTRDEAKHVRDRWELWPAKRRRDMVNKLISLAEDNTELDFSQLFQRLLYDEDPEVRANAIMGLWECDERPLMEPLIRLLATDPEEHVRATAAQALGRFCILSETGKLLPHDKDRLGQVLFGVIDKETETTEVRRRAIEAIGPLSLSRVAEIISDAYEVGGATMRVSAVFAMGKSANPDWLPILLEEVRSEDAEMRYEAVIALGEIGEEDTALDVATLVDDSDSSVQAAAITALGSIGGSTSKMLLRRLVKSEDALISDLAEAALNSTEFEDEPPRLVPPYHHPPPSLN